MRLQPSSAERSEVVGSSFARGTTNTRPESGGFEDVVPKQNGFNCRTGRGYAWDSLDSKLFQLEPVQRSWGWSVFYSSRVVVCSSPISNSSYPHISPHDHLVRIRETTWIYYRIIFSRSAGILRCEAAWRFRNWWKIKRKMLGAMLALWSTARSDMKVAPKSFQEWHCAKRFFISKCTMWMKGLDSKMVLSVRLKLNRKRFLERMFYRKIPIGTCGIQLWTRMSPRWDVQIAIPDKQDPHSPRSFQWQNLGRKRSWFGM